MNRRHVFSLIWYCVNTVVAWIRHLCFDDLFDYEHSITSIFSRYSQHVELRYVHIKSWIYYVFSFRKTIWSMIFVRILLIQCITLCFCLLRHFKVSMFWPNTTAHALIGVAMGMLLVFKTNASYDRYYEGRRLWGMLVSAMWNMMTCLRAMDPVLDLKPLAGLMMAFTIVLRQRLRLHHKTSACLTSSKSCKNDDNKDCNLHHCCQQQKQQQSLEHRKSLATKNTNNPSCVSYSLASSNSMDTISIAEIMDDECQLQGIDSTQKHTQHAIAMEKQDLSFPPFDTSSSSKHEQLLKQELSLYLEPRVLSFVQAMKNQPLALLILMRRWIIVHSNQISPHVYAAKSIIETHLNSLSTVQDGCERIVYTSIPYCYMCHVHHILMIYLVTLPYVLVSDYGWFTFLFVFLVSFSLLGIEAASSQVLDPFGTDENDLPIDALCTHLAHDLYAVAETNQQLCSLWSCKSVNTTNISASIASNQPHTKDAIINNVTNDNAIHTNDTLVCQQDECIIRDSDSFDSLNTPASQQFMDTMIPYMLRTRNKQV